MVQQIKTKAVRGQRVGTPQPMSFADFDRAIRVITGRWGYYNWDGRGGEFYRASWCPIRTIWVDGPGGPPLLGERWTRRNLMHVRHGRYPTHPVVSELLPISRPWDWHALLLEFPAYSIDMKRIAYFRNERDLKEDRRTVTSVAKYVQRHWGGLVPDHVIRDIAARYTAQGFRVVHDIEEMVRLTRIGPHSCQRWGRGDCKPSTVGDAWETHPYQAYDPDKGWGLVVQDVNGEIKSRCLVYSGPAAEGSKGYVRVYGNAPETEAWLHSEGYEHWDGWPEGAEIRARTPWPYIDGCNDSVEWDGASEYVELGDRGSSLGDTEGNAPDSCTCDHCGDNCSDDDLYTVYNGDRVCEYCCDEHYTLARNRHGGEEYYPNDAVTEIDGSYFRTFDLERGTIDGYVQDYDGYWRDSDDCVWCEDADGYVLEEDATWHEATEQWYLNPPDDEPEDEDDEPVEVDEQG